MTQESPYALFDCLPVALLMLDEYHTVIYANDGAQAAIGTSLRRIHGKALQDFFGPEEKVECMLKRALRGETVSDDSFYSCRDHIPHTLHFGPSATQGVMVVMIPEGNRHDAEALFRAQKRTETVSRIALEQAHEVKNPLTSLRGAAQLLDELVPPEQQDLCQHILREADRIRERVDVFLQLGPRANVQMTAVNIHALLDDVCQASAGIRLHRVYDPTLPPLLLHESRLRQAIENLWFNAIEAGADFIEVQTRSNPLIRLPKHQGMVLEIRISSNGEAVPPDLRDRLFEPYVSAKSRGNGLGLAIVQQVIHEHNGRIHFRADGALSRFILQIPIQKESP
ncbi:MAG: ATP-binding protein [Mariprofundaceae bacterium]|nr:ATP-binding protein [Mariprofundaceae bacterium]